MHIESIRSGHWTDEQLIAHIYGVGAIAGGDEQHLAECRECSQRVSGMLTHRQQLETETNWEDVDPAKLAEQRRSIYARLSAPSRWWQRRSLLRWASTGTAALVLSGGLMVYQERILSHSQDSNISDAQLAQEVSSLALESESHPAAPLKGLFE